jgi:hypothetical protein
MFFAVSVEWNTILPMNPASRQAAAGWSAVCPKPQRGCWPDFLYWERFLTFFARRRGEFPCKSAVLTFKKTEKRL